MHSKKPRWGNKTADTIVIILKANRRECLVSHSGRFHPGNITPSHWINDYVTSRTISDSLEKTNVPWRYRKLKYDYLNKGLPTRWHLLYYILLNMFQTLIRPSSGASEYLLCCVGWLDACWCYVVVQPTLGYHITNSQSRYITPTHLKSAQYSLHNNAPSSR